MPTYLIETYLARVDLRDRSAREQRARAAADELRRLQTELRFVRAIHVPEDELCFFVFDAPSSRHAALAAERAGLEPLRIVTALASDDGSAPCPDAPRKPSAARQRSAGPDIDKE